MKKRNNKNNNNMLEISRKLTAFVCALLLSFGVPALASWALGDDVSQNDTAIHQETRLSTNVFWSSSQSDYRTENYITYYPNEIVSPVVHYGSVTTEMSSMTNTVRTMESSGYRVVGGINGDFFEMDTGVPVGLVLTDGVIRSSDGGLYAIGFRRDGSAMIGRPELSVNADFGYDLDFLRVQRRIDAINKVRESYGGIYLFTYDFNRSHSTGNSEWGIDAVCDIIGGSLTIGGQVRLRVTSVEEKAGLTYLGPNQMVLSVNSRSDEWWLEAMRNLPVGSEITISVTAANPQWNDVWQGLGALYNLVEDGHRASGIPGASNDPRTAVGVRPDGSVILYTIDGRRSGHSIGTTLNSVADRLIELGCTYGLCMDGGGSTTISATMPDSNLARVINLPSQNAERAVSTKILLLASGQSTGVLDHFYIRPENRYLLAGSRTNFYINPVDTNYFPIYSELPLSEAYPGFTFSASDGILSDTMLQTPRWGGDIKITASGGGASGDAVIHAIATPDEITLRDANGRVISELYLNPGDSIYLTASASWAHQDLKADQDAFDWVAGADIASGVPLGAFYETGVYTATTPGTGSIAVIAGEKSVYIPVTITRPPLRELEDFETDPDGYGSGMELARAVGGEEVQFGRASAALRYNLAVGGEWRYNQPLPALDGSYTGVSMWILGDGSGSQLYFIALDTSGNPAYIPAVLCDYTGWRQVYIPLDNGVSIAGYAVVPQMGAGWANHPDAGDTGATSILYLDQIVATYPGYMDHTPPAIDCDYSTGEIWGTVRDDTDGFLSKNNIILTYNGHEIYNFYYEPDRGFFYFAPPEYGYEPVRITITAKDASGNLGRASIDIPFWNENAHAFNDIDGYWAADYIDYLYNQSIAEPYPDGGYHPYDAITRVEFAVMLARASGLEREDYADIILPYADLDQIPVAAYPALRALYAENIMRGTEGEDGRLYLLPNNSLTRAQASAMIGRSQNRGYPSDMQLSFPDAYLIPDYAKSHIQIMAAREILQGFSDGTFRPHDPISRGQMAKILYFLA